MRNTKIDEKWKKLEIRILNKKKSCRIQLNIKVVGYVYKYE